MQQKHIRNMQKRAITILCGGAMLLPSISFASLFQNGSFESGPNPPNAYLGDVRTLSTGATDMAGWVVTSRVDWYDYGSSAQDGQMVAQLVNAGSAVSQTFDTVAGQSYTVSFYLDPNYSPEGAATVVDAILGGSMYAAEIPVGAPAWTWGFYSTVFTASSSSSTLEFLNYSGTYNNVGPFLDDVTVTPSVAAVPEPPTLIAGVLLLLPVGSCAVRQLRKKLRTA